MDKETINRIRKEIQKGGIPLQIHTSVILEKTGWSVKQGSFYPKDDSSHNSSRKEKFDLREIDLTAEKGDSYLRRLNNLLVIECKKLDKPWVFFQRGKILGNDPYTLNIIAKAPDSQELYKIFSKAKIHYFDKPLHTYFYSASLSSNKSRSDSDPIFNTLRQVLSAFNFVYVQSRNYLDKKPLSLDAYIIYPLIVVDGDLLSAQVKGTGEIEIASKNHVCLLLDLQMEEPWIIPGKKSVVAHRSKRVVLDVVKKDYLQKFLEDSFKYNPSNESDKTSGDSPE